MSASATNSLRLAVFDCDGTLVDSQAHILAAMAASCRENGLTPPSPERIRRSIGLSLEIGVAELMPEAEPAVRARVVESYRAAHMAQREQSDLHEPLFPGTEWALSRLAAAGWLLAVATGKGRRGLLTTLGRHKLTDRFVSLHTADDGPGKPDPAMLVAAMAEAGVAAAETVMIGDTVFDMQMANAAGVSGLGVSWGYHPAAELRAAGAAFVARDFAELVDRLLAPGRVPP
jgi:phosphoglycolate phosphatase